MLRVRDTLVPLISMSGGTHHSNFAGDKQQCPAYMTIGNQSSKIPQMPSKHSIVIVALLPIPINIRNIPPKRLDEQWQTNREVLNNVLREVLQPLNFEQDPGRQERVLQRSLCRWQLQALKPILSASVADFPENSDLHHLQRHVCFWCECPKTELGDYVPPDNQHPRQDHNIYRTLSDANTKEANAELSLRHLHRGFKVFRHISCIVSDLRKPDLLHTMQIGMLNYLQKWIFHFMKTQKRLDK